MFKKKGRLAAGLLCAIMAAMLIVPVSAHGCHRRGGHHARSAQTTVTVCPYEDCTQAGRHTHDGVTYCGANHDCGYCDGTCTVVVPRRHGCGRWA